MATRLKSILSFAGLVVGVPASLPHNLNWNGRAVVPDIATPSSDASGFLVTADSVNVTVTRVTGGAAVTLLVESWHTIERAFGAVATVVLSPQPFIPGGTGAGASGSSGVQLTTDSTAAPLDVFVDGLLGNDANDGLTMTTALATIRTVYRKFPLFYWSGARLNIRIAGAPGGVVGFTAPTAQQTYVEPTLWIGGGETYFDSYRYTGAPMCRIVPTTGPATAALDVVPAVRVDQAGGASATGRRTRLDFTAAAPGWTANDFQGRYARVRRAGTTVFWDLAIGENTANTLTLDVIGIVGVILSTDTVEIVHPSVVVLGDANNFTQVTVQGHGCYEPAVLGGGASTGNALTRLSFFLVTIDGTGITCDRVQITGLGVFRGRGLAVINCAGRGATIFWVASSQEDDDLVNSGPADPGQIDTAVAVKLVACNGQLFIGGGTTPGGRGLADYGVMVVSHPLAVYNGIGDGISVRRGVLYCNPDGPGGNIDCAILGRNNNGVGLRCLYGALARVEFNGFNEFTAITGGGGDLQIDDRAAVAYGVGVGQFEEVAGLNGNLTNFDALGAFVPGAVAGGRDPGTRITTTVIP